MELRASFVILLLAPLAEAQTPSPVFEVASIKVSGPQSVRGSDGGPGSRDPGRYLFHSATLLDLLAVAYDVDYFQISSKAPLDKERFDLDAKLPAGATKEQFRIMMRNLLAERFHLKLHIETKEFPAYELIVAKAGLKIGTPKERSRDEGFPELPAGKPGMVANNSISNGYILVRLRAQQMAMSVLTRMLRTPGEPPVVDKTGLTGVYDFTLEYTKDTPNVAADSTPTAPAIFTAVQQQLGLQLVSKRLPFDVVVVDAVDRLPSEN